MKKPIVIILITAILILSSSGAFALSAVGCWAHCNLTTSGYPSMTMLYLAEDYSCYYLIQSFNKEEAGLGRTFVGTWEYLDDLTVLAKTGNNVSTKLYFDPTFTIAMGNGPLDIFINLNLIYEFME